jgi:nitroimidazol reductase NimA-like FMN-containing flavoprotein (pyridoxamine 5'-phosphate oxidase superfamily)
MESMERRVGQNLGELIVRRAHLLQANDVRAAPSKPGEAATSMCGSNPIDIGSNDAHNSPINLMRHAQSACAMRDNGTVNLQVRSGPWPAEQIDTFLRNSAIPIRLASSGKSGLMVQSLWYAFDGDQLWCCTQADSVLVRRLSRDTKVAFEVSPDNPPYHGVRGRGVAAVIPERAADVLPTLIDRYLQGANDGLARWLTSRLDSEVAIAISELSVSSWDFRSRMAD